MARKGILMAAQATAEEAAALNFGDDLSDLYDTGYADGKYWAFRLTGGPLLSADTLRALDTAISADRIRCRRVRGYAR